MASTTGPLIDERYVDAPSQRLYSLSLGLLCQAIKVFDFFRYIVAPAGTSFVRKWIITDALYILTLSQLRIPRLTYSKSAVLLQLCLLSALDGLLFGGLVVDVGISMGFKPSGAVSITGGSAKPSYLTNVLDNVGLSALVPASSSSHLLGQHTVRMSPLSTAELNVNGDKFCIAEGPVIIPVLLNNTSPSLLRYSLSPLPGMDGKTEYFDLSSRDLRSNDDSKLRLQHIAASHAASAAEEDEYDDEDHGEGQGPSLQKSQTIAHLHVSKPGVLRLEKVVHSNSVEARLAHPSLLVIAPCPSAGFVDENVSEYAFIRCAGSNPDVQMTIDVRGIPPLSLHWSKRLGHNVEHFDVQGIDSHLHRSFVEGASGPQALRIPLTVTASDVGTHRYTLESVSDGLGNLVQIGSPSSVLTKITHPVDSGRELQTNTPTTRIVQVLPRPQLSFSGCSLSYPSRLMINQQTTLTILSKDLDKLTLPVEAVLSYTPTSDPENPTSQKDSAQKAWTKSIMIDSKDTSIQVDAPGEYTLVSAQGTRCEAEILSPDICKVVQLPRPSADIEWKRIHECSGDTGVSATMVLHGTPPFQVHYRSQRDNHPAREAVKTVYGSRSEFKLQEEHSGHYRYSFIALSDANYKKITLDGPHIDLSVHPLASVDFSHREQTGVRKQINSCSGNIVNVEVDLKGNGPWNVDVQVVDASDSKTMTFNKISTKKKTLQIPLPKRVDKDGGIFTVDLVSVEDSTGCKRQISVPGVTVNVRRIQPTARFYGRAEKRSIVTLQNHKAVLPLRLTGEAPWTIKYRNAETPNRLETARVASPNGQLEVQDKGTYELVEVTDSQCPGTIASGENTYVVTWVDRPYASLAKETSAKLDPLSGSFLLPAVCENMDDHVDLDLTGRPPFQLIYNIGRDSPSGGTEILDQIAFNSIQPRTRFQLRTSEAGRKHYEVKQIGDASYPISKNSQDSVIPRMQRLLFAQDVLQRPSAAFTRRERLSYCHGDSFISKSSNDGVVSLQGAPPFDVTVSIRDLAAGETYEETVTVTSGTWSMSLPSYSFKSIGPHLVTLETVRDASGCEQALPDPLKKSMWVDVAESAAIVPYDRREHFCVGDVSQFQLEGTPPWTIEYTTSGKVHTKQSGQSPFSLVQQQPGEFSIDSIAHQHKMCTTTIQGLKWQVHPLPSATVGHGKKIIQDIYEGDQAEILFTLIGEPPFTFTYQRSELSTKKGKPAKVLETHTVTGVMKREYSIYSALEGTWTVTFISDRYCRFPPIQNNIA